MRITVLYSFMCGIQYIYIPSFCNISYSSIIMRITELYSVIGYLSIRKSIVMNFTNTLIDPDINKLVTSLLLQQTHIPAAVPQCSMK